MDISFQLYSSRNAESQIDVLSMLAKLGYTQVEGYRGVYEDGSALRAAMDKNGLTMPSGHFGVAELESDFNGCMSLADTLGIKNVISPYLAEEDRPTDADGYKQFAARLSALNAKVKEHGLVYAWHNHDFEFAPLADGSIPMNIILDEAPDISWEADLAWIARGNADPVAWLEKYANRIIAVHVKDIAPEGEKLDEDGWADVGDGTMDWARLTSMSRELAGNPIMVMEHDNPSDIERFASKSIAAFKKF